MAPSLVKMKRSNNIMEKNVTKENHVPLFLN